MSDSDDVELVDLAVADEDVPEEQTQQPHGYKLKVLHLNDKLSEGERARVRDESVPRYEAWVRAMDSLSTTGDERVRELVELLNDYKSYVELNLVFDSPDDFLYRQAGQIKLGGSIMEEFLPRLTDRRILPELDGVAFDTGPRSAFSGAYFMTTLTTPSIGGGFSISKKDQDFTISKPVWVKASGEATYPRANTVEHVTHLAFLAAECKTNLDKTMFQEAAATSRDLKAAVAGSRYYLLCDWLDMTPVNTAATAIDEVIILRGKRMASDKRKGLAIYANRQASRVAYADMLSANPVRYSSIARFVSHMRTQFAVRTEGERDVLARGYF